MPPPGPCCWAWGKTGNRYVCESGCSFSRARVNGLVFGAQALANGLSFGASQLAAL